MIMEFYPTELTSPPVPLVALIGKPELHLSLGDFLRSQNVPRVHSIGISDAHSAAGTFGVKKAAPSSATPGILKAGWLRKHRSSRPAVAALLVDVAAVVGDPSAWAWLVTQLDAVKSAVRGGGARIVVIIAQPAGGPALEVPEDRIAMICRQAGVDRRCVLTFAPSEGLLALQVVGKVLHDQATQFYSAEAQRRLAIHAHRNVLSTDLNLRTAFKLGALAEFRGDWAAAVRMYREAYGYVPQVLAGSSGQPQRFAEVRTVAEYVHVKLVSLLLLALKQLGEAVVQFEAHLRLFRRVSFQAPPGLVASHHAWLCRQYTVMAELVLSSGLDLVQLKREQQPGQLYLAAARAAIERRKVAGFISGMHGGKPPTFSGRVEPGLFVGQVLLLPADPAVAAIAAGGAAVAASLAGLPVSGAMAAAGAAKRLNEDQFESYLEAEEAKVQHSKVTVNLLRTAQDLLQSSGRRTGKTLRHAMQLLGHELLEAGDVAGAERLLTEVAGFYRRERWEGPLAATLLLLRECRQQQHNLQAHTELSLELSALQESSLDLEQRGAMATAALSVLALGRETVAPGDAQQSKEAAAGGEQPRGREQEEEEQEQGRDSMQYIVAVPDSGWLTVLPLCAGFFDPARAAAAAPAPALAPAAGDNGGGAGDGRGTIMRFAAGVWNNAPIDLPVVGAELKLQDELGSLSAKLLPSATAETQQAGSISSGSSSNGSGTRQSLPPAAGLLLPSAAWLRLEAAIPVRCSGQLHATALVLQFSKASSLTFQLPSLMPSPEQQQLGKAAAAVPGAAHAEAVGWLRGGWTSSKPPFSTAAGFLPCQCSIEVPPQHTPPLLLLQAPELLLQGEQASVTVIVVAAEAGGVQGAALYGSAVHRESQQYVGLLAVDSLSAQLQQHEPLQAEALQQHKQPSLPLQQQQREGELDTPARGVESWQSGARQSGTALLQQLGDLKAGERRQVVLLLDARYRGTVNLYVELKYTATAKASGTSVSSSSTMEQGHCSALLAIQVQLPWKLGLQVLGPPATHTLLAAPPLATSAGTDGAGLSTSGGNNSSGSGEVGAESLARLEQQQRRLQGLSLQGTSASASPRRPAAEGAAVGVGDNAAQHLSEVLLRSLPQRLVLPAGQNCTVLVQLQSLATCQLDVLAVQLEAAEGAVAVPAGAATATADAESGGIVYNNTSSGFVAEASAGTLCRLDVFTAAITVRSSSLSPSSAGGELTSLGFLRLRWRRHERRQPLLTAAARGAHRLSPDATKAAAAEVLPATEARAVEVAAVSGSSNIPADTVPATAAPAPTCEVLVPLPAVTFMQPLLAATVRYPPTGAAGCPLEIRLLLHNNSSTTQEVGLVVGDPHGFLLAGPKSSQVQVLPHSSAVASWQAVPYHTGILRLPAITATTMQQGQAVEVTRGCTCFVERAPEQREPEEQQQMQQPAPIEQLQQQHDAFLSAAAEPALEPGII